MTSASSPRLVAFDPWMGDYGNSLRKVHAFDSEDVYARYMEHPLGLVTIDPEQAARVISYDGTCGEFGITTYGDFTASDLDAICHLDGFTWRPWLREAQDAMGTKRMVWVLVSDDPRNSDHVIYADKVANW